MEIQKVKSTAEKWQELVLQWETSNKSAKAWCREHGVCYISFICWRKRLKNTLPTKPDTLQASFVEISDPSPALSGIEIHCRSLTITLGKDFDSSTLFRCLQVLEKTSC